MVKKNVIHFKMDKVGHSDGLTVGHSDGLTVGHSDGLTVGHSVSYN